MENRIPFRLRFVLRPSSPKVKVLLILAIALSMAALMTLRLARNQLRVQTQVLRDQAAVLESENARLTQTIDELGTLRSTLRIAREELGLVDPDTVVFQP